MFIQLFSPFNGDFQLLYNVTNAQALRWNTLFSPFNGDFQLLASIKTFIVRGVQMMNAMDGDLGCLVAFLERKQSSVSL